MASLLNCSTAAAGIGALAAYSNAKFHIADDLKYIWQTKQGNLLLQRAGKSFPRTSPPALTLRCAWQGLTPADVLL